MLQSQFLETGIGIVFIFLLMAIMVSSLHDILFSWFSHKGKFMLKALRLALNEDQNCQWAELVYDHPRIDTLKKSQKHPPSYIASSTFANVLIDVVIARGNSYPVEVAGDHIKVLPGKNSESLCAGFEAGLQTLKESHTVHLFRSFLTHAGSDDNKLTKAIEDWFNEYMERVGGWYRRKARVNLLIISAFLTLIMNVDTIHLSKTLWKNALLRESVANAATEFTGANTIIGADTTLDQKLNSLKTSYEKLGLLSLPFGWILPGNEPGSPWLRLKTEKEALLKSNSGGVSKFFKRVFIYGKYYTRMGWYFLKQITPLKLCGWLFTTFAVSFGAPFWFDFLNRLVSFRKSKSVPEK
jgi:hypothetical protein